jgi:epoxyqueuosine reductase QueG
MVEGTSLEERLRQAALGLGADFFGVADLSAARELVWEQGGEMLSQFPIALSVGVVMPFAIVDQLPRHQEKAVVLAYSTHSYDVLNDRLDQIASRLASMVQRAGHRTFPIRASQTANEKKLQGLFSHKLAAHQAGLGWIGKSCLLITPEVGPRVRWTSILTDAPLAPGQPMDQRCGDCRECVNVCPVGAFTGRNFCPSEPREARYDAFKCHAYFRRHEGVPDLDRSVCGMCVYICPNGRNGGSG